MATLIKSPYAQESSKYELVRWFLYSNTGLFYQKGYV